MRIARGSRVANGDEESAGADSAEKQKTPERFGTALPLFSNEAFALLWSDLEVIPQGTAATDPTGVDAAVADASRQLAILLDFIGSRSVSSVSFIRETSYATLNTPQAARLKEIVVALRELHGEAVASGQTWPEVATFLATFYDEV